MTDIEAVIGGSSVFNSSAPSVAADLMLQHLARIVLRQRVPHDHLLGNLEFRDALPVEEVRKLATSGSGQMSSATITAQARSPVRASGRPTMAISAMSGWPTRISSTSFGEIFSPLRMMMSFARPVTTRYSPRPTVARSPVRKIARRHRTRRSHPRHADSPPASAARGRRSRLRCRDAPLWPDQLDLGQAGAAVGIGGMRRVLALRRRRPW